MTQSQLIKMYTSYNNNNINPKPCIYNCNTRIYWNTSENTYFEVFTKKKHICPNRVNNKPVTSAVVGTAATNTSIKPTYYSKKPRPRNQNQRCPTHLSC